MKELEFQKEITLGQLIDDITKNGFKSDNFCLYTKEYTSIADENLIVYLERYPTIDDDEEQYPNYVTNNGLELFYYGEQFEDVLTNILHQKKNATVGDFISGLNYYLDNDAFMTI